MVTTTTLTHQAIGRPRPLGRVSARIGGGLPMTGGWSSDSCAPELDPATTGCAPTGLAIDGTNGYANGTTNPAVTHTQFVKRPARHLGRGST